MTVAALYVERDGVYWNLPDVDPWDEERDARLYEGPHRVVAHPPCKRWSILGQCRGLRDGNDEGCFAAALRSVREYGGVLEHPRYSLAWSVFGMPVPPTVGWAQGLHDPGWVCEVDQRHYGHRSRKPTWLYYTGDDPPDLTWGAGPRGAFGTQPGRAGTIANSHHGDGTDRSGTPEAFRDLLLAMALTAQPLVAVWV